MNTVPTVSDTKRSFYTHHSRPISSIYRRVVEELMVEMHLLSVNTNFAYDSIYALGVVTSFDRFMDGYQPEADRDSIFSALCQSLGSSAEQYRHDGKTLLEATSALSSEDLLGLLTRSPDAKVQPVLQDILTAIAERENFKYSRLFAIGLYTLLEQADANLLQEQEKFVAALQQVSDVLGLPAEKLKKDLEFYSSNLDKLQQARETMAEIVQVERKRREKREQEKQQRQAAANETATEETEETEETEATVASSTTESSSTASDASSEGSK
ncbi:MAG: photosystem II biogenesis protein Psp29 [Cyanobacteria bacterium P01_H01_bin.121]